MLIGLRGQNGLLEPGPTAPYSELSTALGYLLLGSVLCQQYAEPGTRQHPGTYC